MEALKMPQYKPVGHKKSRRHSKGLCSGLAAKNRLDKIPYEKGTPAQELKPMEVWEILQHWSCPRCSLSGLLPNTVLTALGM